MTQEILSAEDWLQVITAIQYGFPVESVTKRFGVTRLQILNYVQLFTELDSCVSLKTITGAISLSDVQPTWLTAAELSLLGVNLAGLGIQNAGRVLLPRQAALDLDSSRGIVVSNSKKYLLYPVPESVLWRLWRLRPAPGSRSLLVGDFQFMEMLMKRLAFFKSAAAKNKHWFHIDSKKYRSEIVQDRICCDRDKLAVLRKAAIVIENGVIANFTEIDYEQCKQEEDE